MKKFFKLLSPLLLSAFLLQYLLIVSAWFGSWLQNGELTYINKADKLLLLPISLIGVTLNTVLIPTLISTKHHGYVTYSAKIGLLLSSFIFCLIFATSNSIATVTFGYGKLTTIDTQNIGKILNIYAFGLPAWILIKLWHASLASIQDNKSGMYGNIIHLVTYITLGTYALTPPTMYKLAVVSVCSVWLNCLFLTWKIYQRKLIGNIKGFFTLISCGTLIFSTTAKFFFSNQSNVFMHLIVTTLFLLTGFVGLYLLLKKCKL